MRALKAILNDSPLIVCVLNAERYRTRSQGKSIKHTMGMAEMMHHARRSGQQGRMWIEDTEHPATRHQGTVTGRIE